MVFYYVNDKIINDNKDKLRDINLFSEYHLEELAEHFDDDEISDLQNRFLTFCLPTEKYLENLGYLTQEMGYVCLVTP